MQAGLDGVKDGSVLSVHLASNEVTSEAANLIIRPHHSRASDPSRSSIYLLTELLASASVFFGHLDSTPVASVFSP